MDVFVVPIGRDRYELYCEQQSEAATEPEAPAKGLFGRMKQRFSSMLREAEERRHDAADTRAATGRIARLQERVVAWMAERIAEQRLLWHLRSELAAVAVHPADMSSEQALSLVQHVLRRDYERHRRWVFVDGILFVATFVLLGPLFLLIPGVANLPALYFGFRTVGHWLSMRGASQGVHRVRWTGRPSPPLTELRELAVLEPEVREQRIHDISTRLRLQHLSTFYERVAV
jgi:polyhydroxyalkanoate synthesis regulator phasin